MGARPWIVDDDLWMLIEPLLPPWPERSPGPRPVPDRLCLQGILYVLYNDLARQLLPLELGFGSGQTCWRRLVLRSVRALLMVTWLSQSAGTNPRAAEEVEKRVESLRSGGFRRDWAPF